MNSAGETVFKSSDRLAGVKGEGWLIRISVQVDAGVIVGAKVVGVEPLGAQAPEKVVEPELAIESEEQIEPRPDSGAIDKPVDDSVNEQGSDDEDSDESLNDEPEDDKVDVEVDNQGSGTESGDESTSDDTGDKDVIDSIGGEATEDNADAPDTGDGDIGAPEVQPGPGANIPSHDAPGMPATESFR
jgi:hypothetical protein